MTIEKSWLLERVQALGPFVDPAHAERTIGVFLQVLRSVLTDDESAFLESELGPGLREVLGRGARARSTGIGLEEFYERCGDEEVERLSIAREHVQIVARAISAGLSAEALRRLRQHLPSLAPLFHVSREPARPSGPDVLRVAAAPQNTLASGKPGSSHPLSEARPGSEHPLSRSRLEPAQTHSVAKSRDPHSDTKLSSAHGLTQEREGESLATTRRGPGSAE